MLWRAFPREDEMMQPSATCDPLPRSLSCKKFKIYLTATLKVAQINSEQTMRKKIEKVVRKMRIQRKLAEKNHSNLFCGHKKCQIGLYVA